MSNTVENYTGALPKATKQGCISVGVGAPQQAPADDESNIYYDVGGRIMYMWVCSTSQWIIPKHSVNTLPPADVSVVTDPCEGISIPVTYTVGSCTIVGKMSLSSFIDAMCDG